MIFTLQDFVEKENTLILQTLMQIVLNTTFFFSGGGTTSADKLFLTSSAF